jgi:hypothetical protein
MSVLLEPVNSCFLVVLTCVSCNLPLPCCTLELCDLFSPCHYICTHYLPSLEPLPLPLPASSNLYSTNATNVLTYSHDWEHTGFVFLCLTFENVLKMLKSPTSRWVTFTEAAIPCQGRIQLCPQLNNHRQNSFLTSVLNPSCPGLQALDLDKIFELRTTVLKSPELTETIPSKIRNQTRMPTISTPIQHSTGIPSQSN